MEEGEYAGIPDSEIAIFNFCHRRWRTHIGKFKLDPEELVASKGIKAEKITVFPIKFDLDGAQTQIVRNYPRTVFARVAP